MWGAFNQPNNLPKRRLRVGSFRCRFSIVYDGGAVTLSSVTIAPTGGCRYFKYRPDGSNDCHLPLFGRINEAGAIRLIRMVMQSQAWSSSNGNVAVSSSGLATAAAVGTATVTATVTGGVVTSPGFGLTVNAPPLTLSSITIATTGGVTSITAPANNQLLTTCHYNDGTATSCNAWTATGTRSLPRPVRRQRLRQ